MTQQTTTPGAVPESILQKVQKLMALQERAGSPEEAANATSKIADILVKYNLDMATVAGYKAVEKSDVIHERHDLNEFQNSHDGDFGEKLINTLAAFNFCRIVLHLGRDKKDQGSFTIIGQKHNVEIVTYMFTYVLTTIKGLAKEAWDNYDGPTYKNKFMRAFYHGAVRAVNERLTIQKVEQQKEHGEQILALVRVNDKAVAEKTAELFPNLKKGSGWGKLHNSDAMGMGYEAGKNMNLAKGLEGGTKNTKQIK